MDKNELIKIFADRLVGLMIERDIENISDLSRQTNIPRNTINNWLNLKRSPHIYALMTLSKFFEVKVDYLVGLKD